MAVIPIKELAPGMILDADVRDLSGRLLLKAGEMVSSKHLTIFKTWGVPEVNVRAPEPTAAAPDVALQAAVGPDLEEGRRRAEALMRHVDLTHPVMVELFKLATARLAGKARGT